MKTRATRVKKETVAEALERSSGKVYLAARSLKITPKTLYNYLDRWADLKQFVEDKRNEILDIAETALHKAILNGEAWAVCFCLKTQGKARGYTEKTETEGILRTESAVQVYIPSNDRDQTTTGPAGEVPGDVG